MVALKKGPLTLNELMELWVSVTDPEYSSPLLEKENSHIEVIQQAAEQFAAVSLSIDRNTQGMFILPWSGQTQPPASGPAKARATLKVTRTALFEVPLYFTPGDIIIQHRLNDFGEEGPVDITTGRLYVVEYPASLAPGEAGPVDLNVVAMVDGPGFNVPTPDTLRTIIQPGVGFSNAGATVQNGPGANNRVITATYPDVPITGHVGQYLKFVSGANTGKIRRISGVENPDPTVPHGGVFALAAESILAVTGLTGTFSIGERITQPSTRAVGYLVAQSATKFVVVRSQGTMGTGAIVGDYGGTATVTAKEQSEDLVEEFSAGWVVLGWAEDLSVAVTNEEQPQGGAAGFLDELGNERGLPRHYNEGDEEYRRRISKPADVVSPGAVIRAGNRVLEPFDEAICLREVGRPLFQGAFYDGGPSNEPFCYDLDLVEMGLSADGAGFAHGEQVVSVDSGGILTYGVAQFDYVGPGSLNFRFTGVTRVRGPGFEVGATLRGLFTGEEQTIITVGVGLLPEYRFNTYLSIREFRGFFLVGVPRLAIDDFGVFYDVGPNNAYDVASENFYDGAAIGTNSVYSRIWDAVNGVRPAGVPFDIYIEDIGCI